MYYLYKTITIQMKHRNLALENIYEMLTTLELCDEGGGCD
jgi:hypothetical protein